MLTPSACKKQLGANMNEQPRALLCVLTAVLNCTRRGDSSVTSWKGEKKIVGFSKKKKKINLVRYHFLILLRFLLKLTTSMAFTGLWSGMFGCWVPQAAHGWGSALTTMEGLNWLKAARVFL